MVGIITGDIINSRKSETNKWLVALNYYISMSFNAASHPNLHILRGTETRDSSFPVNWFRFLFR